MNIKDSSTAQTVLNKLDGRKVFLTTSWDDGLHTDVRLVELGQRYGIPMMLFVAPHHSNGKALTSSELRDVASRAEIGSHTLSHVTIDTCSREVARERALEGRAFLEERLGRPVPHFCLVGGRYTMVNLKTVIPLFESVRSTHAFNFSRPMRGGLVRPSLQLHFDARKHPMLSVARLTTRLILDVFSSAMTFKHARLGARILSGYKQHELLDLLPEFTNRDDLYLHLWGHSEEVERSGAWRNLEDIFSFLNAINAVPLTYSQFLASKQ